MSTTDLSHHGCAEIETDSEDWVVIVCDCGLNIGQFPDNVTAIDALIDHVVEVSRG